MKKKLVIGSRGSQLALTQTHMVKNMLEKAHQDLEIEVKVIVTSGDSNQSVPMVGDGRSLKIDFVKEIERALLDKEIDLAVHSMKDMPLNSVEGLEIGATPSREDYRDVVLIREDHKCLQDLPSGSVIGTSSLRRGKSLREMRPDFMIKPIRGNVGTRIRKMTDGGFDAIILAAAGLKRLDMEEAIDQYLEPDEMMPAPAQGILGIQCRSHDDETKKLLEVINDEDASIQARAERTFGRIFDGGCHTPMGCVAVLNQDELQLRGMYIHEGIMYKSELIGSRHEPEKIGKELADDIWRQING